MGPSSCSAFLASTFSVSWISPTGSSGTDQSFWAVPNSPNKGDAIAGDWIKVEQATVDKPEVLRLADLLSWDRRQALGLLVEFWCWLDKNLSRSCPDFVRNMSRKSLDEVLHVPGFSAALEVIGWAKFDDEKAVMTIINASRHNGITAKTRALDAKRKKEKRLEIVPEMSVSKPDKKRTREEKRRDITPIVPARFAEFWESYPGPRRISKSKCLKFWGSNHLDPLADQILSHVTAMRATEQWRKDGNKFAPSTLTYLNQRRWEDGQPLSAEDSRRLAV